MCALNSRPLTKPSLAEARHLIREVGVIGKLEVAEIVPGGERKACWIFSLLDLAEFLIPPQNDAGSDEIRPVKFSDPKKVVEWTRKTIGDVKLADRMDAIIATGGGYTVLAPQLGHVTIVRVAQCWKVIEAADAEQETPAP